jgi:hypothetical protein
MMHEHLTDIGSVDGNERNSSTLITANRASAHQFNKHTEHHPLIVGDGCDARQRS